MAGWGWMRGCFEDCLKKSKANAKDFRWAFYGESHDADFLIVGPTRLGWFGCFTALLTMVRGQQAGG
jgi:hypothetical protein